MRLQKTVKKILRWWIGSRWMTDLAVKAEGYIVLYDYDKDMHDLSDEAELEDYCLFDDDFYGDLLFDREYNE